MREIRPGVYRASPANGIQPGPPGHYIGGIVAGLVILAVGVFVAAGLYYNVARPAAEGTAKSYTESREVQSHGSLIGAASTKQNKTKRVGQSGDALLFFCALRLVGFVRHSLQEQKGRAGHTKKSKK